MYTNNIKLSRGNMNSTETQIVPVTESISIQRYKDQVLDASFVDNVLKDVIDKTKTFTVINGKKHVKVEGWETLGAMMRCTSEVVLIKEYKNGYWSEAIIKDATGTQLSKGIGICLRDESNWKNKDDYAILSMAQTRSIGKAYRLAFSWIMSMAGYEPCPAEEMEQPQKQPENKFVKK